MDWYGVLMFFVVGGGVALAFVPLVYATRKADREAAAVVADRLAAITAERLASDKAWTLAELAFAEVKPLISDDAKAKVLRAIYARIKLHLEAL